jgi:hypothetical protein
MAAILWPLVLVGGCAVWDADRWNPEQFRDERAVEIDQRLSRDEPIVKNPF